MYELDRPRFVIVKKVEDFVDALTGFLVALLRGIISRWSYVHASNARQQDMFTMPIRANSPK